MTSLSVIVVSYNTEGILKSSLAALVPQLDFSKDELIVVDNRSTDGTAAMVRRDFPQANLMVLDKDYGYAYGANRGFEKSKGEYVLVMSSDISFPQGTISTLVRKMVGDPKMGILCPEFVDFNGMHKQLTWQWSVNLLGELLNKFFSPNRIIRNAYMRRLVKWLQRSEKSVSWVSGAAFLIRRDAMAKVNGFDETFQLYYEDTDLCVRVRQAGYSVVFTPEVRAFHALGESTKTNEKSKIYLIFIQSRLYYYQKHVGRIQLALLKVFLRRKFASSLVYQTESRYRQWVDSILDQKASLILWQDIQL